MGGAQSDMAVRVHGPIRFPNQRGLSMRAGVLTADQTFVHAHGETIAWQFAGSESVRHGLGR